jgi:predicted metal-dependent hydrolase
VSGADDAVLAEDHQALVREGARLYNGGEFWEAHEAWEEVWLQLREADRRELADLLQALILTTAAFENLDRGKPRGFATQGAKALHRLRGLGDRLPELGVADGARFTEELLDAYLDVQRLGIDELTELEADPPDLVVD